MQIIQSIFSSEFFQITSERFTVTLTVYPDKLVIKGFKGESTKIIEFQSTSYSVNWDSIQNENASFTLCIYQCRAHSFQGTNEKVTQLRTALGGKIAFLDWKKEYVQKKWVRNTKNSQIFQVLRGESLKVMKVLADTEDSQELGILKKITEYPHPNILTMDEYYEDDSNYYIVMDNCSRGPLYCLHQQYKNSLPPAVVRKAMQQILEGVNHFHQLNIIHRDLKYDNILITERGEVKIIDFGLAQKGISTHSRAGTGGYIAPEVFRSDKITNKSDIFSLGVVFHKLLTGKQVFDNMEQNQSGKMRISSQIRDSNALDLVHQMLKVDPEIRFSAEDCLAHPYFINEHDSPASKLQLTNYLSPKFKCQILSSTQVFESIEI